jgi:hypothetical protein
MARKGNIIEKRCTKSGRTYKGTFEELTEFFYRDKSQKDGLSPWSKEAERAYNQAYRAGLKAANAPKKAGIVGKNIKARRAAFETAMQGERVVRGTHRRVSQDGTRTPQAKARTRSRNAARVTKQQAQVSS